VRLKGEKHECKNTRPFIRKYNAKQKRQMERPKTLFMVISPAVPVIGIAALSAYAVAPKKLRALAWVGPALVHGVIPALDRMIGEDQTNPPEKR
jgi:alkane 1-monooxygenase